MEKARFVRHEYEQFCRNMDKHILDADAYLYTDIITAHCSFGAAIRLHKHGFCSCVSINCRGSLTTRELTPITFMHRMECYDVMPCMTDDRDAFIARISSISTIELADARMLMSMTEIRAEIMKKLRMNLHITDDAFEYIREFEPDFVRAQHVDGEGHFSFWNDFIPADSVYKINQRIIAYQDAYCGAVSDYCREIIDRWRLMQYVPGGIHVHMQC